ncbi:MAG: hypothetical protein KBS41_01220, partial [Oscillospiraceae bacterium]|nr:hypothetical protein [Candidatus Equicaccousia limihippi]
MSERYKVVKLIEKVENGGYSTLLLNSVLSDMQAESSPYITRAFYGVTERKLTPDYILSKYSDKPLKKLPTFVLCVMRLALYECLYMDNTQSYAAVNEAVEMIKKSPNKPLYGYVNAVLRNAVKYDIKYLENKSPEIKYSVNPEIFDIVSSAIGCENAACFFENSLHKSEVFVMVNTIKSDLDTIISDCGFEKTSVNLVLRAEKFNPEEPHFKNGDYFVID